MVWYQLNGQKQLRARRIGIDGNFLYPNGDIVLTSDKLMNQFGFALSSDKEGSAFVAWGSSENAYSIEHSNVQKINPDGELIWGKSGIMLDDWNK